MTRGTLTDEVVSTPRLIPVGVTVWSISNQMNIIVDKEQIVLVKHYATSNDFVFVAPQQLLFNSPGYIPTLCGRGTDEWHVDFHKTLPYEVPKPQMIGWTFKAPKKDKE